MVWRWILIPYDVGSSPTPCTFSFYFGFAAKPLLGYLRDGMVDVVDLKSMA